MVLFNGVDDGGDALFDVGGAEEVHEVQRQLLEPICVVLKLLDVLPQIHAAELFQHVGHQHLVSYFEAAPQHSDVSLADVQKELGEERRFAAAGRS